MARKKGTTVKFKKVSKPKQRKLMMLPPVKKISQGKIKVY